MSRENLDVLRRCFEAVNRDDLPGAIGFMDPEIRFECQVSPVQGSYVGHDGVRQFFADMSEHFGPLQLLCPDLRDLGDRVLGLGTAHGVGKGSGMDIETPLAVVAIVHDGRITHYKDFGSPDQALAAVGLSE
jgi:ketosteroid isomerase-like protein